MSLQLARSLADFIPEPVLVVSVLTDDPPETLDGFGCSLANAAFYRLQFAPTFGPPKSDPQQPQQTSGPTSPPRSPPPFSQPPFSDWPTSTLRIPDFFPSCSCTSAVLDGLRAVLLRRLNNPSVFPVPIVRPFEYKCCSHGTQRGELLFVEVEQAAPTAPETRSVRGTEILCVFRGIKEIVPPFVTELAQLSSSLVFQQRFNESQPACSSLSATSSQTTAPSQSQEATALVKECASDSTANDVPKNKEDAGTILQGDGDDNEAEILQMGTLTMLEMVFDLSPTLICTLTMYDDEQDDIKVLFINKAGQDMLNRQLGRDASPFTGKYYGKDLNLDRKDVEFLRNWHLEALKTKKSITLRGKAFGEKRKHTHENKGYEVFAHSFGCWPS